jgi:CheY-like chemotaxis protein
VLLFQSARELLINAVKHAETTTAAIEVAVDEGLLRIQVRDEGKGFDISRTETQKENQKFGLLSIQERMKALGGSFTVTSAPGEGTTAALILPLTGSIGAQPTQWTLPMLPSKKTATLLVHPSSRLRVLLVDDHAMIRQGLKSVLDGYDDLEVVGEAGDGREALELAERLRPTVVVMDINMPNMNGIEATRVMKRRHPDIRIIGLSVSSGGENQEAMKAAGATVLLTKEAAAERLYAAIRDSVPG